MKSAKQQLQEMWQNKESTNKIELPKGATISVKPSGSEWVEMGEVDFVSIPDNIKLTLEDYPLVFPGAECTPLTFTAKPDSGVDDD